MSSRDETGHSDAVAFATTTSDHRGVFLCGLNKAAEKEGLRSQMRLADARALYPTLKTLPVSPDEDEACLQEFARIADHFSPWVSLDGPHPDKGDGGLWLDMTGAAHLFDGEENLMTQVRETYQSFRFNLCLGMADTALGAWAAARFHTGNGRLNEGNTRKETLNFPLGALNLDEAIIQRLNRLGLRCLGDLHDIPRANMTIRFGPEIITRLDQLLGFAPVRLTYLQRTHFYEEKQFFADPLGSLEIIEDRVTKLLESLCLTLREAGLGIRRLGLRFTRVDNHSSTFLIATSAPSHDLKHLMRLLQDYLPGVDPGFGIEHIHIRAVRTQWMEGMQVGFSNRSDTSSQTALSHLVDRLRHRLGPKSVTYPGQLASHIPERSMIQTSERTRPLDTSLAARPVRLLSPPEPLTILEQDNNNLPLQFRWRRMELTIDSLNGPERITREWWRKLDHDLWNAQLGARDYFRADDQDGHSLWLCRVHSTQAPQRWFVHGWFG